MVLPIRLPRSGANADHADGIAIATLYLLVMMIMAVWIRLAFRYYMLRSLQWDDGMVSIALILGISQSAVVFTGTQKGLGKLQSEMSKASFTTVEKDLYSSDLLYVLSLSLAKVSVLQFLEKLCVNKLHKTICRWSSLLVVVWTVPVFFTLAFKCGASSPWDTENGHCINVFDFWAAISPIDIATELVICILPMYIVKPVQVSFSKKVTVIVAFVFRASVIVTTIVRLIFMKRAKSLADMNDDAFATSIMTQLTLCVSLMTACIPCLKPFLDAFDSGMLNVSLHKRLGGGYSNSYGAANANSYALGSMNRGAKESTTRSQYMEDEIEGLGSSAAAFAVTAPVRPAHGTGSMAIQRTDQWSVRCEYVDQKSGESVDETEISDDRGSRGSRGRNSPL